MTNTKTPGDIRTIVHQGNFPARCRELRLLKDQIATLEKEAKPLADEVKKYVMFAGTKTDSGGFVSDLEDYLVEARAKTSVTYNMDKVRLLMLQRPELLNECVRVSYDVDTDAINRLYEAGTLTSEEVKSMTDMTTSHSLYVTNKDKMPEVQQAAQKKRPLPRRRK